MAPGLTDYGQALLFMEARVDAIRAGEAAELIWLVEHPPVYTAGTSAHAQDLIDPRFPVHHVGRGGQYTYHGPGQRMIYVMLDLGKRGRDVRRYVTALEGWIIAALGSLGVTAHTSADRVGVWVDDEPSEAKIAAIGVRIRRWVTFHGAAINVATDLAHFDGIVPCGLANFSVTSLNARGKFASMADVDAALATTLGDFLTAIAPGDAQM